MDLLKKIPGSTHVMKAMKLSPEQYAKKFSHPALRFAIKNAMTGYNNAFFFMHVYGLFSVNDGTAPLEDLQPHYLLRTKLLKILLEERNILI